MLKAFVSGFLTAVVFILCVCSPFGWGAIGYAAGGAAGGILGFVFGLAIASGVACAWTEVL